jgi:hypothetical protein
MQNMPISAIRWYKMWICAFPESWHPNDLERFYMFVSVLLANSKKERSRFWLETNLKKDCPKLSEKDIEEYCNIYEHIRDFNKVWKSQLANLTAQEDFEKRLEELRKK